MGKPRAVRMRRGSLKMIFCRVRVTFGEPFEKAKTPLSLGDWPAGAGNASDITVSFSRPTTGAHDRL